MSDYRALTIGEKAPHFQANTTFGPVNFPGDYQGRWVVFFSHPGDYSPVCTTELMTFASMAGAFEANNTALLGLSVDSNQSHIDWSRAMERYRWNGIANPRITFPIVADEMGEVARLYGMLMPASSATRTVRTVFVVDPEGVVRAILAYPLTTGRNIREILRLVLALQAHDKTGNSTPAHWVPGDPMLLPSPQTLPLASKRAENGPAGAQYLDWYLCFTQGENAAGAANANTAEAAKPNIPAVPANSNANAMPMPANPNANILPAAPAAPKPVPGMGWNLPAQTFPAPPVMPVRPQPAPSANGMLPPVPTPYGFPAAQQNANAAPENPHTGNAGSAGSPNTAAPAVPVWPNAGAQGKIKSGGKGKALSMDEIMKMLEEVGLAGDLPRLDGTPAPQPAKPNGSAKAAPAPMPNPAQPGTTPNILPVMPPAPKPAENPKGNAAAPAEKPAAIPAPKGEHKGKAPAGGIVEQNRMLFGGTQNAPEEYMITRDYPYKKR